MVLLDRLILLPSLWKRVLAVLYDLAAVSFSLWLAFALRLGEVFLPPQWNYLIALGAVMAIPCFAYAGLYRLVVRHLGYRLLWITLTGVTLATLSWATFVLLTQLPGFPRSVIFIYWFIAFVLIAAGRLVARSLLVRSTGTPIAIYGAGSDGIQLAIALQYNIKYHPVVFFDDNKNLQGSNVINLRVHPPKDFPELQKRYGIREVLIAIHYKTREQRNRLVNSFKDYPVRVRVLPLVSQLMQGNVALADFEAVSAEDLLGRDSVPPDKQLLTQNIEGKNVMVTGAGGSVGSELCRQIVSLSPCRLVLVEQSEHALYQINMSLCRSASSNFPEVESISVLGSVMDGQLMEDLFRKFGVETVYHAAAYKHVPLVEDNPIQGIKNNTLGTLVITEAAEKCGVETFVLISTDKAVRPSSVMGASKRLAEMILQEKAKLKTETCFSMVRFGNVIDSSGSVVPLFRDQIKQGRHLTVTHRDMTRYFMLLKEAVELVIQAGSIAKGGEVFALDMGDPVNIEELARTMVLLSGKTVKDESNPDGIEIQYTGVRPGEKLVEELLIDGDADLTQHPKILRCREKPLDTEELRGYLNRLEESINSNDVEAALAVLDEAVGNTMGKL